MPADAPLLRFVVLRHEGVPEPHFDLMFETSPGSSLATWRSDRWPLTPDARVTPLADHRADYLAYEGPLSGDRGHVQRVASGSHRVVSNDPTCLTVHITGEAGPLVLLR